MDQTTSTLSASTLHCALELSKNSWLLAIQFRDREQPSLYPIEGGNTDKLMAKLAAPICRCEDEPHPSRAIVRACSRVASHNGAAGYKVMLPPSPSFHQPIVRIERAQH